MGGDNRYDLSLIAHGKERVSGQLRIPATGRIGSLSPVQPEMGAILALGGCERRGGCISDPTFRKDALTLPDAVVQEKQAEASVVAGRCIKIR